MSQIQRNSAARLINQHQPDCDGLMSQQYRTLITSSSRRARLLLACTSTGRPWVGHAAPAGQHRQQLSGARGTAAAAAELRYSYSYGTVVTGF